MYHLSFLCQLVCVSNVNLRLQLFRINTQGQLGLGERCIQSPNGDTLHVQYCDIQPTGPWEFDEVGKITCLVLLACFLYVLCLKFNIVTFFV